MENSPTQTHDVIAGTETKADQKIDNDKLTDTITTSQNIAILLEGNAQLTKERDHLLMGITRPEEYVKFCKQHLKFINEKIK